MNPIEIKGVSKRFGKFTAVDNLSFVVRNGCVTGFLGRNGAGKTTVLRMLLGLCHPSSGEALIEGRHYAEIDNPSTVVGAVLDGKQFHPGRSGRNHLRWVATALGLPSSRIDEVLEIVDLTTAQKKRVGKYSLGMRQRLAIATALLGDPKILILDEPANGLDPQGMRWLRDFLVKFARQGKSVLVSSHILAELAQFADEVVVIEKGRFITQSSVDELTRDAEATVRVKTPDADQLSDLLKRSEAKVERIGDEELLVQGLTITEIGELAAQSSIPVHGLSEERASLEDVFIKLTTGQTNEQKFEGVA